ncbi:hypothetical protein N0V93_002627 [Gnomoniopsis smithogilvyi]|uniref:RCC1-like domain-containing protein n=1 Tax=Gnomoniopsis smithogilvyi TaxID=1191159 RepID=A0A9W9CZ58_9PEZI|nr:hypothetical protein N0V93_002627 [Gnomoniopsis smithogilvyi]
MPRKTSANAPVAKPTKAPKAATASKRNTNSSTEKSATNKPVAATTASKKTAAVKSADAIAKANISKKRHRDDEEEEEDEKEQKQEDDQEVKPKAKKTKVDAAPKVSKSKPAASKSAAPNGKTPSSKASSKETAATKAVKTKSTSSKRKAEEVVHTAPKRTNNTASKKDDEPNEKPDEESGVAPTKAATKKAAPKKAAPSKTTVDPIMKVKIGAKINTAPAIPLDIFVFGEGSAGELGLGANVIDKKRPIDVKRPRKNPLLSAPEVGVVQVACGGMHGLALTKDNKILSWGVNDQGALGRSTKWDGGLRDVDASDSDSEDDDDTGLNPVESTPAEIDTSGIAPGTKFVQVAGCDSASFALTEDGRVYGWGTFRSGDGILGFSPDVLIQEKPALLPEPTKVVSIATGSNHVMTLDVKGKIQTWGAPEQNQLGRRVVVRDQKASALRAGGLSFKRGTKITKISCGSYHSFALDDQGRVWAFGLNNFGQLGLETAVGDDNACQLEPTIVDSLAEYRITDVLGGEHHTLVITEEGKVLVFGRIDGHQLGLPTEQFNKDNSHYDEHDRARILAVPSALEGLPKIVSADAGTDTSYVITEDGRVYSWGFNTNYQCGIGETDGDVLLPQLIDNTAVKDKKVVFAGAGGQFGILASIQEK